MKNPPEPNNSKLSAPAEAETRRQYLQVDAVDPTSGKNLKIQLCYRRLTTVAARSRGQMLEARDIVPFALQYPTAIFEGLCWDDDEPKGRGVGWRCYVSVPEKAYARDGRQIGPYDGEVFLVFVNGEGIAYHWYWSKCDENDPCIPYDMDAEKPRFKTRLL